MIRFSIAPSDPKAHLFSVTLKIDSPSKRQQLSLPAWLPGSYMIRDFCRNIISLKATQQDAVLPITQLDKQRWQLENESVAPIFVSYQVYAFDLSVRSAHLDMTHGFFNGSSVFLAVEGQTDSVQQVEILPPTEPSLSSWRLATTLPANDSIKWQFGHYQAENYDALIDHPVEMGDFTLASFKACGTPHHVVLTGRHRCHMQRLCDDLKAICETQIRFFGGKAPFDEYLFMTMVLDNGFGGLEHRSSTALVCSRKDLPLSQDANVSQDANASASASASKDANVSKDYRTYLSLCSHEYFHNWNVKRIKPDCFTPYDLASETYTRQLWAYEGITSYYDDLLTLRAGKVDVPAYLDMLSETMTRVTRGKGRLKQSLRESSFNAWTKFYKQDENAQNAIVSYYTKGALFALYLDLTIRSETQGKASLDTLMQLLWQRFGLTGQGTAEDSHQQLTAEILGRDVSDLFAYLDSTDDLPLEPLLSQFGVKMVHRAFAGQHDAGGGSPTPLATSLGAKYKAESFGVRIQTVAEGGSAHLAGLSAGDLLVAVDHLQAGGNLDAVLDTYEVGAKLDLHFFRRDELMQTSLTLQAPPLDTISLQLMDETAIQGWLG